MGISPKVFLVKKTLSFMGIRSGMASTRASVGYGQTPHPMAARCSRFGIGGTLFFGDGGGPWPSCPKPCKWKSNGSRSSSSRGNCSSVAAPPSILACKISHCTLQLWDSKFVPSVNTKNHGMSSKLETLSQQLWTDKLIFPNQQSTKGRHSLIYQWLCPKI